MITMVILPKTSHKQEQSEKYKHSIIIYPIVTLKGDKKNKRVWKLVKQMLKLELKLKTGLIIISLI